MIYVIENDGPGGHAKAASATSRGGSSSSSGDAEVGGVRRLVTLSPRGVKRRDRDVDDDERPSKTTPLGAIAARAAVDAGLTRARWPGFHDALFALFDEQDKARERHG